jgi:hypothetical protein
MQIEILQSLVGQPATGLIGLLLVFFILVLIGSIIIWFVGALIFFIPAAVVAAVVWFLTGDSNLAGLAFLLVALLSLTKR